MTRDRELVTTVHLRAERSLARDHLIGHSGNFLVAWIPG
jgi:hypothetical protein